jgi:hypothetical protein
MNNFLFTIEHKIITNLQYDWEMHIYNTIYTTPYISENRTLFHDIEQNIYNNSLTLQQRCTKLIKSTMKQTRNIFNDNNINNFVYIAEQTLNCKTDYVANNCNKTHIYNQYHNACKELFDYYTKFIKQKRSNNTQKSWNRRLNLQEIHLTQFFDMIQITELEENYLKVQYAVLLIKFKDLYNQLYPITQSTIKDQNCTRVRNTTDSIF